jgi:hypothetical protein
MSIADLGRSLMRGPFALACLLVVFASPLGAAPAYVVSPRASDATKAAVAEGHAPEHGFPEIRSIRWTSARLRPGSALEAFVTTSPNVGYVEGRYKDWNLPFERTGLGTFHLVYKVPFLPPFLLGRWHIDVIARSVDGVEVGTTSEFSYGYF